MDACDKIIASVLHHNGAVFGGFLRDTLYGVKPNDLDVSFQSEGNANAFMITLLRTHTIKMAPLPSAAIERYRGSGNQKHLVRLVSPDFPFAHIDIVLVDEFSRYGFGSEDCNVNMLYLTAEGLQLRYCSSGVSLFQTVLDCQAKSFRRPAAHSFDDADITCDSSIKKLLTNGWSQL